MEQPKQTTKKQHAETARNQAKKYYLLGLNLSEVSKLMDIPEKTIEKWQQKEGWVKLKRIDRVKETVINLKKEGLSNSKISDLLNISTSTVWRYCKINP
ncbi:helix-turn-helix domain-containing protein [Chryseobacterium profundimaris]|uniref:Winged helix-turn-helix DNA-binding n=1 Tax=Chryseobacterium profundimaris TaxID=1387275 RepID=A0ABY1NG97_9FLAO|nr:helix-turn-helix domain-containing protein [Chryseobacterium profundimaris]SMP09002.1 Winged helix-turn-helix DNA-binding [Chryseobacterium profundimaris]